jgi:AraC-like DNA-binding protein
MHKCVSALPCPELREYVRAFAQREISASTPDILQPVPACLESILELDFGNSPIVEYLNGEIELCRPNSLIGPHTHRRAWIRLRGPVESFGVFFRPLALWQLFQIPIGLLVNRAYSAEAILGSEVLSLRQRMAEPTSFEERVRLVEEYLLRRVANVFAHTEVVSSALDILAFQGAPSVARLANHAALGVRQFERRFGHEIGMAPKLFARIARYQLALDSKVASPARSWLSIAHEFGYHDQMHMIRDFQSLSGSSPGGIVLQLGDMRPAALDASSEPLIQAAIA